MLADRDCRPLWRRSEVRVWDVDAAHYFAETDHVSRSGLELFRKSPSLYAACRVNDEIDDEETAALRRGRALHYAVLQPERERELVRVVSSLRGKAADAAKKELPPQGVLLTTDQAVQVAGMARAVREHPLVGDWLRRDDSMAEVAFQWVDDETGLRCKMMVDHHFLNRSRDRVRAWDLKSTRDPSPRGFTRSVADLGYHRQEAFYRDALARHYEGHPLRFFFVAVRDTPPHEVGVYQLDETFLAPARAQVRAAMARLADHKTRNDWRAPWELASTSEPYVLTAPRWAQEEP